MIISAWCGFEQAANFCTKKSKSQLEKLKKWLILKQVWIRSNDSVTVIFSWEEDEDA